MRSRLPIVCFTLRILPFQVTSSSDHLALVSRLLFAFLFVVIEFRCSLVQRCSNYLYSQEHYHQYCPLVDKCHWQAHVLSDHEYDWSSDSCESSDDLGSKHLEASVILILFVLFSSFCIVCCLLFIFFILFIFSAEECNDSSECCQYSCDQVDERPYTLSKRWLWIDDVDLWLYSRYRFIRNYCWSNLSAGRVTATWVAATAWVVRIISAATRDNSCCSCYACRVSNTCVIR